MAVDFVAHTMSFAINLSHHCPIDTKVADEDVPKNMPGKSESQAYTFCNHTAMTCCDEDTYRCERRCVFDTALMVPQLDLTSQPERRRILTPILLLDCRMS